jgi:hypothetical protein
MPIAELCQLVAVQSKRLMIMLAIMKCKIEIAEANFLWDIYTTMFLICCTNRNDKKSLAHQVPDTTSTRFHRACYYCIPFKQSSLYIYGRKGLGQACALNERSLYANYQVLAHVTAMFYLAIGYFGGDFLSFCEKKKSVSNSPVFLKKKLSKFLFIAIIASIFLQ